jgi:putative hydrolase of HD superfamily
MKPENILELLLQVDNLKDVLRVGWSLAGLTYHRGESVAEHSWGTMNVALIIGNYLKEENTDVEMFRVMVMAIIHDYAESFISDIPKPAIEIGGDELVYGKHKAEVYSIQTLLGDMRNIQNFWKEYDEGRTIESRIVRAADIIDMLVHALKLEKSGASPELLHHFFTDSRVKIKQLEIPIANEIYLHILSKHESDSTIK